MIGNAKQIGKTTYVVINTKGTVVKANEMPFWKRLKYEIIAGYKNSFQISKKELKDIR